MSWERHGPEQKIRALREPDRRLSEGPGPAAVYRDLEVLEETFHRWRNQYGGMKVDEAKRLKELEIETCRLKHDAWGVRCGSDPGQANF